MTRIALISAGMSQTSSTTMLINSARQAILDQQPQAQTDVIELRPLATDITNAVVSGVISAKLQGIITTLRAANGYVFATPVYQGSFSGLFKMFLDILEPETFQGKPVLLMATGGSARHSLVIDTHLRSVFAYLRALSVPTAIFAAPEDWANMRAQALTGRVAAGVTQLLALSETPLASTRSTQADRSQDISLQDSDIDLDTFDFDTDLMRMARGGKQY